MEIEEALCAYLNDQLDCPLYPGNFPQDAPNHCANYQRNTGGYGQHLTGPHEFTDPEFKIEVRSPRYAECIESAELLRQSLSGFTGTMGDGTSEREVFTVIFDNESDSYVKPVHANDVGYYVVTVDVRLIYPEEI